MIIESTEWKRTLRADCLNVRKYSKLLTRSGTKEFLLDRIQIKLSAGALIARRLMETPKVSSYFHKTTVRTLAFPWRGSPVDHINWHRIDEKYQLNNARVTALPFPFLCDQIIHSFVWVWGYGRNVNSFLVSSDRKKHSQLFQVSIYRFTEILLHMSGDYPSKVSGTRVPDGNWTFFAE